MILGERVHCQRACAARPDAVWAVARAFCAPWHPDIDWMVGENGGAQRAFTVRGDQTRYRERLTYLSDSDRDLAYRHIDGIAGVHRYDARLRVVPDGSGCRVHWHADIEAGTDRLQAIAQGTRQIFERGLDALCNAHAGPETETPLTQETSLRPFVVEGAPRLALTVTPHRPGPLCLFLHGIGGARDNWTAQLPTAGAYGQAAALDLRGYGESALGDAQSTLDAYCSDILRVCASLGADRLVLCGLSYGAWIATAFALRHPDRLLGLILSGGCTGLSEASAKIREGFRANRLGPLENGRTPADLAPTVVDTIAGPQIAPPAREALMQSMSRIPSDTYRDAVTCFTTASAPFDFARLRCPVLLMTGDHDRLAPPDEIRAVAHRMLATAPEPEIRFEVFRDAGHVCNLEAPDAYNRHLGAFLHRLTA